MFESVGWGELTVLLVLALFVFGPERLPTIAGQAGRWLRQARRYLTDITDELSGELGPELGPELGKLDLRSSRPTDVVRRLLTDQDDTVTDRPPAPGQAPSRHRDDH